jgi:hypothetical protein|tara:strand:- start:1748 stop:2413 length:666 start_codon:yes stop_codon:yes gene_type:complete
MTYLSRKNPAEEKRKKRRETAPGMEDLLKLSRGIFTEDDELEAEETDELEEARKEKPDCIPGNPHHGSDGKFSTKSSGRSWSKTHPDGAANDPTCKHGQRKSRGRWTRVRCGRELDADGKPSPRGFKADYRCKDGKKIRESFPQANQAAEYAHRLFAKQTPAVRKELVKLVMSAMEPVESKLTESQQLQAQCKAAGFYRLPDLLNSIDAAVRASKGDLNKS